MDLGGFIAGILTGIVCIGAGLAWLKWLLRYFAWLEGYSGPDDPRISDGWRSSQRLGGYIILGIGVFAVVVTVLGGLAALVT